MDLVPFVLPVVYTGLSPDGAREERSLAESPSRRGTRSSPSRHMTSKQRRINVDASHRIDIDTVLFLSVCACWTMLWPHIDTVGIK